MRETGDPLLDGPVQSPFYRKTMAELIAASDLAVACQTIKPLSYLAHQNPTCRTWSLSRKSLITCEISALICWKALDTTAASAEYYDVTNKCTPPRLRGEAPLKVTAASARQTCYLNVQGCKRLSEARI